MSIYLNNKFCEYDKALLSTVLVNGTLKKRCNNCKREYPSTATDTLLYESVTATTEIPSEILLKNISKDPCNTIVMEECTKCGKPFKKLFISNDLSQSYLVCSCNFTD